MKINITSSSFKHSLPLVFVLHWFSPSFLFPGLSYSLLLFLPFFFLNVDVSIVCVSCLFIFCPLLFSATAITSVIHSHDFHMLSFGWFLPFYRPYFQLLLECFVTSASVCPIWTHLLSPPLSSFFLSLSLPSFFSFPSSLPFFLPSLILSCLLACFLSFSLSVSFLYSPPSLPSFSPPLPNSQAKAVLLSS